MSSVFVSLSHENIHSPLICYYRKAGRFANACLKIVDRTTSDIYRRFAGRDWLQDFLRYSKAIKIEEDPSTHFYPTAFFIDRKVQIKNEELLNDHNEIHTLRDLTRKEKVIYDAMRVGNCFVAVFEGVVMAVPLLVVSLAGLPTRYTLLKLEAYNDIVYLPAIRHSSHYRFLKAREKMKLLTYNIMSSEVNEMCFIGGVSQSEIRDPAIAHFLYERGADIVCLQEAFRSYEVMDSILKPLSEEGYSSVAAFRDKELFGMNSGLVILVKGYEIVETAFHPYQIGVSGVDARASKGVLVALVKVDENAYVCIANTHMQAGIQVPDEVRKMGREAIDRYKSDQKQLQYDEAMEFIIRFKGGFSRLNITDTFFMGDFNSGRFRGQDGGHYAKAMANPSDRAIRHSIEQYQMKDLIQGGQLETYQEQAAFNPSADKMRKERDDDLASKNETGGPLGTTLYTKGAFSYEMFPQLLRIRVARFLMSRYHDIACHPECPEVIDKMRVFFRKPETLYETFCKRFLEAHLSWTREELDIVRNVVFDYIEGYKRMIGIKPEVCDHIFKLTPDGKEGENARFSQYSYQYKTYSPMGSEGPLSDHLAVEVICSQRPRDQQKQKEKEERRDVDSELKVKVETNLEKIYLETEKSSYYLNRDSLSDSTLTV